MFGRINSRLLVVILSRMSEPLVTVVVAPRERFSVARRALEALYAGTPEPFRLVYIAAGAPPALARYLAAQARARGFQLVEDRRALTPNQARNLALPYVDTRYVAFIDNDAVPEPGWLGALLRCAEETGAWIVGPLYYFGDRDDRVIHMAGGDAHFETGAGRRRFVERHRFVNQRVERVRDRIRREPCEQVEFHCMLIRRDVFDRLGPLDEGLRSMAEHTDLCLQVREAGGTIYFEPAAAVTYVTSGRLRAGELAYFARRWSEGWTAATVDRFCEKWRLDPEDPDMSRLLLHARGHRHLMFDPMERALVRVMGWRCGHTLRRVLEGAETRLNRWWFPYQAPAPARREPVAR